MEGGSLTSPTYDAVARRAAARLAPVLDPKLAEQTEQLLADQTRLPGREYFNLDVAISLAGFLLSVVSTGWTIYRDLKHDRQQKAVISQVSLREHLISRLSGQVGEPRWVSAAHRNQIIDVVADEIVANENPVAAPPPFDR
jgi:hypothetical protein